MKNRDILLLGIIILSLTGCVPKTSKIDEFKSYNIKNEIENNKPSFIDDQGELKAQWWKIFADEQLDRLILKAITNAPTIKSIEAKYGAANNAVEATKATAMPQISAKSSITRERFSINDFLPPPFGGGYYSRYQLGGALEYDFDFWNAKEHQISVQKSLVLAQKASLEVSRLAISSAICKLYLSWSFDEKRLDILNRSLAIAKEGLDALGVKYKNGLTNKATLNEQDIKISKISQQINEVERVIEGRKEGICILAGMHPSEIEKLKKPKIKDNIKVQLPKNIYLDLLSKRADISVQKQLLLAKSSGIEVAKTRFYPNINLSSLIGLNSLSLVNFLASSSFAPNGQVAFSLPIFDWGERKAVLNESVNEYNAEVYEYNNLVIKAANEVVGLLKKSKRLELQIKVHKDEMKARESNSKIALNRLEKGLDGKLPYLATQIDTLQGLLDESALQDESASLQISLIKALGGGYHDDASE